MIGRDLNINNLSFSYGKKEILDDVTLRVTSGNAVGITGRNGCGKTTFLKLVGGLLYPSKGTIRFEDKNGISINEAVCAQLLETPVFWQGLTGGENLRYFLRDGYNADTADAELKKWGMEGAMSIPVAKYSMGMRQKLGLILTILSERPILLWDEPSNSLDMESTDYLQTRIREICDEGRTVLVVSHVGDLIRHSCSEIYQITDGCIRRVDHVDSSEKFYEFFFSDEKSLSETQRRLEEQGIFVRKGERQLTISADKLERILYLTGEKDIIRIEIPKKQGGSEGIIL